jgi:phospholipase D1/2
LERRGLWAVIVMRVVPVAPYALVNLVLGAARIRLLDFILGTAIGLLPGIAALAFGSYRVVAFVKEPTLERGLGAGLAVLLITAAVLGVRRLLRRHEEAERDAA